MSGRLLVEGKLSRGGVSIDLSVDLDLSDPSASSAQRAQVKPRCLKRLQALSEIFLAVSRSRCRVNTKSGLYLLEASLFPSTVGVGVLSFRIVVCSRGERCKPTSITRSDGPVPWRRRRMCTI